MSRADRHYTGEAGEEYHRKKHVLAPSGVQWVAALRAKKIQPRVRPTDTVFEYGAGSGWNLLSLRCARRIGYDISEHAGSEDATIEWTRSLSVVPSESVHVVICHHALEHVLDPATALGEMHSLLKPGGLLLLFVPFEKERRYRQFDPSEPNHHLFSWNVQTLGNLVTECQFAVKFAAVGEFGYDRFAASIAAKWKLSQSGFRLIRRLAHLVKPASEVRIVAARN